MRIMPPLACLTMSALLTACEPEPSGQPVLRTEIGKGEEEAAAIREAEEAEERAALAATSVCKPVTFENVALTHCTADPATHRISTALANGEGENFGSLDSFSQSVDVATIAFAMNGGMYGDDREPVGYYVERGERLSELDRSDGDGNFYMKPNGVFFGTGGKWEIKTADDFYRTVGDRPAFGTQSGPMLVIKGEMHPDFQDNGPSRAVRNGVGIAADGKAHFVISEEPISFGQFARFFRDELKTPSALYLDGQVSVLWDPATGRLDSRSNLGPLLIVTKQQETSE